MNKWQALFELNKRFETMNKEELIKELLYLHEVYLLEEE